MVMGLSGSAYGRCAAAMSMSNATIIDGDELVSENCTSPAGHTHDDAGAGAAGLSGNILLDFPEDDPLLLVGRMCLAVTLALAFPMLTIPGTSGAVRDLFVFLRASVTPLPALLSNQRQKMGEKQGSGISLHAVAHQPSLTRTFFFFGQLGISFSAAFRTIFLSSPASPNRGRDSSSSGSDNKKRRRRQSRRAI
jgi:hypothetical protein